MAPCKALIQLSLNSGIWGSAKSTRTCKYPTQRRMVDHINNTMQQSYMSFRQSYKQSKSNDFNFLMCVRHYHQA